ncbi:MAG: hypothetical protein U0K35_06075 [Prevotella sp.]|nr:hypothetical protein [Prevotella sp.]
MYQTIADIQTEKRVLKQNILNKEKEMSALWTEIFHKKEEPAIMTPTQRLLSFANKGAGIFDGALFSWKIYKKFRGKRSIWRKK